MTGKMLRGFKMAELRSRWERTDYGHIHVLADIELSVDLRTHDCGGRNLCSCGISPAAPRS